MDVLIKAPDRASFMDPNGYIVTNNHVVEGRHADYGDTERSTRISAKVVGTDPKTDLAVVKIDVKDFHP